MLKSRNAGTREDNGEPAADASGDPAVGGGVCEQRYAAERVLPHSGFELQHAGSPSEETAMGEEEFSRLWTNPSSLPEFDHQSSRTAHAMAPRLNAL